MNKLVLFLIAALFSVGQIFADECSDRYRAKVFDGFKRTSGIYFGTAPMAGGAPRDLYYDVYEPEGDTASLRPLVILWHGGAFIDGLLNKNSPDIVAFAHELSKRGYVVISSSYRGVKGIQSIFSEKTMVQGVVRAVLDGNAAICHIFNEIENGNSFRIDKDQVFAGGVSAGAVLGLHGLFLESLDQMPPLYAGWARELDNGVADEALANKFCGGDIKGFINISGAVLDTAWIAPSKVSYLHIHGTEDPIVPYDQARPLGGLQNLPILNGTKPIHEKSLQVGLDSKVRIWEGKGHVPFFNLELDDLLEWGGSLINEDIFNATLDDMVAFLFDRIECEPLKVISSTRPSEVLPVLTYPNPSDGQFKIEMPLGGNWNVEIRDIAGRLIRSEILTGNILTIDVRPFTNSGMYVLQVSDLSNAATLYNSKVIIAR
jgi:para-nitrobenzyl esterase